MLKQGSLLYIKDIDGNTFNYEEVERVLSENGVSVDVLAMPTPTAKNAKEMLVTKLLPQLMKIVDGWQKAKVVERQQKGIKSAKARGVKFGRSPIELPENFFEVVSRWEQGELSAKKAMELTGLKENTFYRRYNEFCKDVPRNKRGKQKATTA